MRSFLGYLLFLVVACSPSSERNIEFECQNSSILTNESSYETFGFFVFDDIREAIECSKVSQKPTLLYFTGYGAVGCKPKNRHPLLDNKKTKAIIAEHYNFSAFYVDSKTKLTPDDHELIAWFEENYYKNCDQADYKLRTIGNLYLKFQICFLKSNAQPLLVVLADENTILAQQAYTDKPVEMWRFLNDGIKKYRDNKKN